MSSGVHTNPFPPLSLLFCAPTPRPSLFSGGPEVCPTLPSQSGQLLEEMPLCKGTFWVSESFISRGGQPLSPRGSEGMWMLEEQKDCGPVQPRFESHVI